MSILDKKPVFLNDWSSEDQVFSDFETTKPEGVNLLLASYSYANYSGDAFVLFHKDGKLYEVNGGHCSCYGLEGQWAPEETTVEALNHRLTVGKMGTSDYSDNEYAAELKQLLS